jgi:hypothetical protein
VYSTYPTGLTGTPAAVVTGAGSVGSVTRAGGHHRSASQSGTASAEPSASRRYTPATVVTPPRPRTIWPGTIAGPYPGSTGRLPSDAGGSGVSGPHQPCHGHRLRYCR